MGGLVGDDKEAKRARRAATQQIIEQRAENARLRREAELERAQLAEEAVAKRRARLRGGSRMLLSQVRATPEAGLETLGAGGEERT